MTRFQPVSSNTCSLTTEDQYRLMFSALGQFINIGKLPRNEIINVVSSFNAIVADCDGVLWIDNEAVPGSVEVINRFIEIGKKVYFLANSSTRSRDDYAIKAKRLGFNIAKENILTTAYLVVLYLQSEKFKQKAYVIGSQGLVQELNRAGIKTLGTGPDILPHSLSYILDNYHPDPDVGAVIVGFDEHFSYVKLLKAASYLNKPQCLFVATNTNERVVLNSRIVVPGTGAILNAVEMVSKREALVVGKPHSFLLHVLMNEFKIHPADTLLIGDRCDTDVLLGARCGFQTLLVLSGATTLEEVTKYTTSTKKDDYEMIPDYYMEKLGDFLKYLV